jgi:hypothetical protein
MGAETTAQRPTGKLSRRQLFKYGASAGAAATVGPMLPTMTSAAHAHGLPDVLPAPKPIPGGITLPDGTTIHVFAPGPPDVTLPFTGIQLMAGTSSPASSPTTRASPPWPSTSAPPPAATAAGTTWKPTCGRWRAPTSPRTARGVAACSPSYELTCSSPVRAPRSMTSTTASFPRACSGWWSCPATPSRSATTGGGRPWKPRTCASSTASSSADRSRSRPRSASRSSGSNRAAGTSRQRLGRARQRSGGVPGPFRRRAVHRVVLRIRGRVQLQGQGRHRPRLRPAGPRT